MADVETLAQRASSGDAAAVQVLCERLAPAMRVFARRRLGSSSADDFTQDALLLFVSALKRGRLEDPRRVAGFALGICRTLASERAKVNERRAAAVERLGDAAQVAPPHEPHLFHPAQLEDCLSQLSGGARRVLLASYWEEQGDGEIAAAQSLSPGNVRVIRHRSLVALRECLQVGKISWEEPA